MSTTFLIKIFILTVNIMMKAIQETFKVIVNSLNYIIDNAKNALKTNILITKSIRESTSQTRKPFLEMMNWFTPIF